MFITLLIGQAVLIILLICALVHWIRKRNQQNSARSPLDRLDSCKTEDEITAPCKFYFKYICVLHVYRDCNKDVF